MAEYNPILSAPQGANKKPKRVGRGSSSGLGTTAGKGNKGQQSRSGGKTYVGFEGGQMPLYRRIARKGFSNYPFKKEYVCINVELLETKYKALGFRLDAFILPHTPVLPVAMLAVPLNTTQQIKIFFTAQ